MLPASYERIQVQKKNLNLGVITTQFFCIPDLQMKVYDTSAVGLSNCSPSEHNNFFASGQRRSSKETKLQ
jgi:hypothetical protein